jgi:hypothetical protein
MSSFVEETVNSRVNRWDYTQNQPFLAAIDKE